MFKYVLGIVAVAVAASVGFALWSVQQKREEHRAITALVAEGSAGIAQTLKQPSPELAAKLEATAKSLENLKVKRQKPYAEAADVYLVSARTLAQRQADVLRLSRAAEQSRVTLLNHIRGPRGRGSEWIRNATELQRRMDNAYSDLARVQDALIELLRTLPEAEKQIVPYAGAGYLTEPAVHEAAIKRARDDRARAAQEADAARRLQ